MRKRHDRSSSRRRIRTEVPSEQPIRDATGDWSLPSHERSSRSDRPDAPISLGVQCNRIVEADFFEEAPCGYVVLALDGTSLQTNRAFHVLIGQPASSQQKPRFQDLLSRA